MKRLAAILFFSLSLFSAFCQETENTLILPEHAVGITGGVNLSFFNLKPAVSQPRMPVQASIGIQYRVILEKYFGLWFQLNYDQRGFKSQVGNSYRQRTFDYIEMPIFAHITFGRRIFRFHIDLGPSIGYMIKKRDPIDSELPEFSLPVAHRFDYGVTGMLGFEVNTAKAGIYQLNVRYNGSFSSIFTRDYDNFTVSAPQSIVITAGWMWRIKPKHGYRAYDLRVKKKLI
ncbi:MAG: PorT family protein [bacterium]|nr:PorT family protein [Candidatus Minthenecus merdequi]